MIPQPNTALQCPIFPNITVSGIGCLYCARNALNYPFYFPCGALASLKATTLVAAWLKTTDFQSHHFQPALAGT